MSAKKQRKPVRELDKKIRFLIHSDLAAKVCGHNQDSLNSFANTIGIPRKTLEDGIADTVLALNEDHLDLIAQRCRFDPLMPEWRHDPCKPDTERKDTAEEFIKAYQKLHRNFTPQSPARRLGLRLRAVRIDDAWQFDSQLASLDFFPRQAGAGEPWPADVCLSCQPAFVEGIELAVRRGRVIFDCGAAQAQDVETRQRLVADAEVRGEHGPITIRVGGTRQRPSLELDGGEHYLGVVRFPEDFALCEIADLAPGDEVTVRFLAYFKDLEMIEADSAGDAAEADGGPSASFMFPKPPPGGRFSHAKQKIFTRLAELELPNREPGLAELCRDARRFEAMDDEQGE